MKIIISPAKKMNVDTDTFACEGTPVFLEETTELMNWIRKLSRQEAQKLWCCNDKLAELNFERFQHMDLLRHLTPALISYEAFSISIWRLWYLIKEHGSMYRKTLESCQAFMAY